MNYYPTSAEAEADLAVHLAEYKVALRHEMRELLASRDLRAIAAKGAWL